MSFGVSPKVTLKVTPKVTFWPQKSLLSHLSGQKVTFGVTFRLLWGRPQKSLFSHFRVTLNFSGFRGFWEVRKFSTPGSKIKNSKNQKIKNADLCDFLMPVSSRYKAQKINISGPGFYASGEHDFSKPRYKLRKSDFPISDSIFRLTEVSEFSKPQRGQSTKASGTHKELLQRFGGSLYAYVTLKRLGNSSEKVLHTAALQQTWNQTSSDVIHVTHQSQGDICSSSKLTKDAHLENCSTSNLLSARILNHQERRWHVCRTKLPPKNFEIDTKNGLKNAKKESKKTIRNVFEKFLAPLRPLKNISPALFNNF